MKGKNTFDGPKINQSIMVEMVGDYFRGVWECVSGAQGLQY